MNQGMSKYWAIINESTMGLAGTDLTSNEPIREIGSTESSKENMNESVETDGVKQARDEMYSVMKEYADYGAYDSEGVHAVEAIEKCGWNGEPLPKWFIDSKNPFQLYESEQGWRDANAALVMAAYAFWKKLTEHSLGHSITFDDEDDTLEQMDLAQAEQILDATLDKYSHYGATDTEPMNAIESIYSAAKNGNKIPSHFYTRSNPFDLYQSEQGWEMASAEILKAVETVWKKLIEKRLGVTMNESVCHTCSADGILPCECNGDSGCKKCFGSGEVMCNECAGSGHLMEEFGIASQAPTTSVEDSYLTVNTSYDTSTNKSTITVTANDEKAKQLSDILRLSGILTDTKQILTEPEEITEANNYYIEVHKGKDRYFMGADGKPKDSKFDAERFGASNTDTALSRAVDYKHTGKYDSVKVVPDLNESLHPERKQTGVNDAPKAWANEPNERIAQWKEVIDDSQGLGKSHDMFPNRIGDNPLKVAQNKTEAALHEDAGINKIANKLMSKFNTLTKMQEAIDPREQQKLNDKLNKAGKNDMVVWSIQRIQDNLGAAGFKKNRSFPGLIFTRTPEFIELFSTSKGLTWEYKNEETKASQEGIGEETLIDFLATIRKPLAGNRKFNAECEKCHGEGCMSCGWTGHGHGDPDFYK